MGHYTGHHFRVILKAHAPEGILDQLRGLAGLKGEDESSLPNPAQLINSSESTGLVVSHDAVLAMLAEIKYNMNGWSAYIGTWTEHNRLTLSDDGRWELYTKCSNKYTHHDSIRDFLNSLLPFMDMEEGDVVFRAIYEDGQFEDIYYLSGGEINYKEGGGYYYYNSYDDSEHPGDKCDVDWDPPMNIGPLREATKVKMAKQPPGAWWQDPWAEAEPEEDIGAARTVGLPVTIDSITEVEGEFAPFEMPEVPEAYMDLNGNLEHPPLQLPFVVRPIDNDIPEDQQRGYASKEEVEIGGQKYIQYFGPFTRYEPGESVLEGFHTEALLNGGLDLLSLIGAPTVEGLFPKSHVGMGRYYSESIRIDPAEGNGKYAQAISHAYYHETDPWDRTRRVKPARAKRLAKLKRYAEQVCTRSRESQMNLLKEKVTPWQK